MSAAAGEALAAIVRAYGVSHTAIGHHVARTRSPLSKRTLYYPPGAANGGACVGIIRIWTPLPAISVFQNIFSKTVYANLVFGVLNREEGSMNGLTHGAASHITQRRAAATAWATAFCGPERSSRPSAN
jgi:hypothetical protein